MQMQYVPVCAIPLCAITLPQPNKDIRPRNRNELHPRLRDAIPAPLRHGRVVNLEEISDNPGPAQSINDFARIRDAQVVFHGPDLSTLNFKSEVLLSAKV
ncbi:hypothetical protein [Burkholderia sp. AU32262]|uniref:hypothetical protein n=1 Tax=Burkholderia sp. AU32262 TaxID=2879630 RepID=UPI001CF5C6AB|nr:hypothetical protein [Burkholderia sp. AU32262]MCA8240600.1 hypothetical protein [Burkholderia sp. AU32262]